MIKNFLFTSLISSLIVSTAIKDAKANPIDPVPPDSTSGQFLKLKETASGVECLPGIGCRIYVFPTNNGERIKNKDAKEVTFRDFVAPPNPSLETTFFIPAVINGKYVTDFQQETQKGDDPGTLYVSVFDNGIMTTDPLVDWFVNNNYLGSTSVFMPDFFPVGFTDVYYGVNLADFNNAGKSFVENFSFGDIFTIDGLGKIPELPRYIFSSTPLTYIPGTGWSGTEFPQGTQVKYVAFHEVSVPVPEPTSTVSLLALGTLSAASALKRKRN